MRLYITLILTFLLAWSARSEGLCELLPASNPDCPNERIIVHLSQECLLTGEVLFFKIYCTSPLYPATEISSVSFVELVSSDNKPLVRKKILLEHGEGSGDIEIPATLSTGAYYLSAYTSWMKNFGEETFFIKKILIINPYQPLLTSPGIADTVSLTGNSDLLSDKGKLLTIRSEKNHFGRREKIILKIDQSGIATQNPLTGFSVSVCRKGPSIRSDQNQHLKPANEAIIPGKMLLPDHKGILLSGKLFDLSGAPKKNAALILSFPGPGTHVSRTVTGNNGEFSYLLEPGIGEEDVIFTMPDAETRLTLDESFWNGFRNAPGNRPLFISENAISYLKQAFYHYQLRNIFKLHYYERCTAQPVKGDSSLFYSKPYRTFYIKNYVPLDSIGEYFYELIPSVKFTKRRGVTDISVYDEQTAGYLKSEPGVFLDGVLMKNKTAMLGLPVADVDRITVLPSDYYYKDMEFGGIIDVHTTASDFKSAVLQPDMTRLLFPKAVSDGFRFTEVDYSSVSRESRQPDLRYLLVWKPWVKADSNEPSVEFYSGDVEGTFIVKVTGLTLNGVIVQAVKEITIGN